jgi:hypothetical protein
MSCNDCGSQQKVVKYKCPPGLPGFNGWTPLFAVVADGDRAVLQVSDWYVPAGYDGGVKPPVGQYVGASSLVDNISQGVDVRGLVGPAGPAGPEGLPGEQGGPGLGLIDGGLLGQVLRKKTDANQDTEWGNEYRTTATSQPIDVGVTLPDVDNPVTFNLPDSNNVMQYAPGMRVRVAQKVDSNTYMEGVVQSYTNKNLQVKIDLQVGTGTISEWNVNLGGSGLEYTATTNINGVTPAGVEIKSFREAVDLVLKPVTPHRSNFTKGGHHNRFNSMAEINAIPAELLEEGMYAILNPSFSNLQNYAVEAGLFATSIELVGDRAIAFGSDASSLAKIYVFNPITLQTLNTTIIPSSAGRVRFLASYGTRVYYSVGAPGSIKIQYFDTVTYALSSQESISNDPVRSSIFNGYLFMPQRIEGLVEYINLNGVWGAPNIIAGIAQAWSLGYDELMDRVFVFPYNDTAIKWIDNASNAPTLNGGSIIIPGAASALAYCNNIVRDGHMYFVAQANDKIYKISLGLSPLIVASLTVGDGPQNSIYYNGKIFIANNLGASVSVVKTSDFTTVLTTIPVGPFPIGSASSSMIRNGNYIFVPCYGDSNGGVISVIDANLNVNIKNYVTTGQVRSIVYYAKNASVFGGSNSTANVSIFSYQGLQEFCWQNSSWVNTTAPSIYGGIIRGPYSYEQDFSDEFIDDSFIPDNRHVKKLMDERVLVTEIQLTSAQVLTLNTATLDAVPTPGVGKAIEIVSASALLDFNSTAYSGNVTLDLITDTATVAQMTETRALASTVKRVCKFDVVPMTSTPTATQIIEDKSVKLKVATGNPVAGNSIVKVYITYKIITL